MADANIGQIVATTLRDRQSELADNITDHIPLLMRLTQKGQFTDWTGGRVITEPLIYGTNSNFKWYEGYESFSVAPQNMIDAAEYDWKQSGTFVTLSGLDEIKNSGKFAALNLIEARIKAAKADMKNNVSAGLYADGTGNGGKEFGGLQLIVADDPTTGTVGGIDGATFDWWRNQFSASATTTSSNIQERMNDMFLDTLRNKDSVDLILTDKNFYTHYWESLQAIQRIASEKDAAAGFQTLKFQTADVIYDSDCPADRMYFLNTDYLAFRCHPRRKFSVDEERQIQNADYVIIPIWLAGNVTCCNRERQGVIIG